MRKYRTLFCQALFYENIKVPGKVRTVSQTEADWFVPFMEMVKLPYLNSLSLLVKCHDLLLLANFVKMSQFTHFVTFW